MAYGNSHRYGGSEYHINYGLMEIGLAYWYSMSVESRLILKEATIQLYRMNGRQSLQLARTYGQLHMVCIWVKDKGPSLGLCERELEDRRSKGNHR